MVLAALAISTLGVLPTNAAALPVPTVTVTGPATPFVGQPAVLAVLVATPSAPGETVTLEKGTGFSWATVGTATLGPDSRAAFSVTPPSTASIRYRVKIAASPTHAAGVSATYSLAATLVTPTATLTGPYQVTVNTPGVMTAAVTDPAFPGETVALQKRGVFSWATAGTAVLDANSRATFTVTPTTAAATRYRITLAKTATHAAVASVEFVLNSQKACGGAAPTKPDGTPWVCSYYDEFTGAALDRSFWVPQVSASSNYYSGTAANRACFVDQPDTIALHDGVLELSAKVLDQPITCGTATTRQISGMVMHHGTYSQTYGKYEIRAKLPALRGKGLQETFWLWPDDVLKYGNTHPASGEIDLAEFYSFYPDLDIPVMHYLFDPTTINTTTNTNIFTSHNCRINYGQFNTYGLEWVPGQLKIFVNGTLCIENNYRASNAPAGSPYAPFDQPFFLALTQAFGTNVGGDNSFDEATGPALSSTQIDYVRIWK
jgi:beta-glucanase (GH16 family)